MGPRRADHDMSGHASKPQNNAGMLDGVDGVIELGANNPHPLQLGEGDHARHPERADDLGVVVQEEKVLPSRLPGGQVVDAGEVEGNVQFQHPEPVAQALLVPGIQLLHGRVPAAVIGNEHLIVGVLGLPDQRIHAPLDIVIAILGGDNHRHQDKIVSSVASWIARSSSVSTNCCLITPQKVTEEQLYLVF